jgi:hypothetical protein
MKPTYTDSSALNIPCWSYTQVRVRVRVRVRVVHAG